MAGCCECGDEFSGSGATKLALQTSRVLPIVYICGSEGGKDVDVGCLDSNVWTYR
jgi:hypothetical protein